MLNTQLFARILKVDEAKRLVYGRAADETVDKENEVFDYETSKPYFQQWSAEVRKDSGGKSLGNIRGMHGNIAAGKVTALDCNDVDKAIDIVVKVVDDNEWDKVLEGVYNGFSIGGKYAKKWPDVVSGKSVTRYTAKPSEISMVDRPCNPNAMYTDVQKTFQLCKRDGSVEVRAFKNFTPSGSATSGMTAYDQEGAGVRTRKKKKVKKTLAFDVGSVKKGEVGIPPPHPDHVDTKKPKRKDKVKPNPPPPRAADSVSNRERIYSGTSGDVVADGSTDGAPVKSVGASMQKGMNTVVGFVCLLRELSSIVCALQCEQEAEGDKSTLWQDVADKVQELGAIGGKLLLEESSEVAEGEFTDMYFGPLYRVAKSLSQFEELRKEGRRNSASDLEMIQHVHDTACKLGASCMSEDDDEDEDEDEASDTDATKLAGDTDMRKSAQSDIKSEGNKRGAGVTDGDGGGAHSDNEDDKERTTATMGSHGPDRGFSSKRKKAQKDADEDEDDDEDEDEDEDEDDDDDDDEDEAGYGVQARNRDAGMKSKKARKKAKKMEQAMEGRITKNVTNGVLDALRQAGVITPPAAAAAAAGRSPALNAVGKGGDVSKSQGNNGATNEVTPVACSKLQGEADGTNVATLIKSAQRTPLTRDQLYKG